MESSGYIFHFHMTPVASNHMPQHRKGAKTTPRSELAFQALAQDTLGLRSFAFTDTKQGGFVCLFLRNKSHEYIL